MQGDLRFMAVLLGACCVVASWFLVKDAVVVTRPGLLAGGLVLAQMGIIGMVVVAMWKRP